MSRQTLFSKEARKKVKKGVDLLYNAVRVTQGAQGRHVIIRHPFGLQVTKDGVTVARSIKSSDPVENIGIELLQEVAGKTVEMAGDGTTTATVLAHAMITHGLDAIDKNANPISVASGIQRAVSIAVQRIKELSRPAETKEILQQIATISANNDQELGHIIGELVHSIGKDGQWTVGESRTERTFSDIIEGMRVDRGYAQTEFINDPHKGRVVYSDVDIVVCEEEISSLSEILPLMGQRAQQKIETPILFICQDFMGEAMSTLVVSRQQQRMPFCVVKAPGMGNNMKAILEDISTFTGATIFSKDRGMAIENGTQSHLGKVSKIIVTNNRTVLIGGNGDPDKIAERIQVLKLQIEQSTNDSEKEFLKHRLGSLSSGVGVIYVGGKTESEVREKKDRVDDSLNAAKSALEAGFVVGGGQIYIEAAKAIDDVKDLLPHEINGFNIVKQALYAPVKQMLENAGFDQNKALKDTLEYGYGFDQNKGDFCNLFEAGIIDPTKVACVALENAASICCLFLTTECVSCDVEERGRNDR